MQAEITLPFPPSVNRYWRSVDGRVLISRQGREYRAAVSYAVQKSKITGFKKSRIAVDIRVYPPDRRRRDIDNMLKAPLDALQAAGVYDDDGQIDELRIVRGQLVKPGKLCISISEIREV